MSFEENEPEKTATLIERPVPNAVHAQEVKAKRLPPIPYPPELFPLHTLEIFCGERGSGKTNAFVLMMQRYLEGKFITRLFVMAPTYDANTSVHTLMPKPEDVYKDQFNGQVALQDILKKVENEALTYAKHKEYNKAYKRWKDHRASLNDTLLLTKHQYMNYGPPVRPVCALMIDDMSKTNIYSPSESNPLCNLCLRHRHIYGIGISIYMLVQNFKVGVPKFLRENVQQFFLWKTSSIETLMGIYDCFGNLCTLDQFLEMYVNSTEDTHHFLTVDGNNPNQDEKFRRDFDTYLIIPNFRPNENALRLIDKIRAKYSKREREGETGLASTKKFKSGDTEPDVEEDSK